MDRDSRTQEEQGLECGMSDQVHARRSSRRGTHGNEHQAILGRSRARQCALGVRLDAGDDTAGDRRREPRRGDGWREPTHRIELRGDADEQVGASGNQGGRVKESGNRCRAGHRRE